MNIQPWVGAQVHYRAKDDPLQPSTAQPRAAIVTELNERHGLVMYDELQGECRPVESVGLCVLDPNGIYLIGGVSFAEEPTPGFWSWPPKLGGDE